MSTESFVNLYKQPPPKALTTAPPTEPYDINFSHPLPLDTFKTKKVKLTPFLPHIHANPLFVATVSSQPGLSRNEGNVDVWQYLPFTPLSVEHILAIAEEFRSNPGFTMFAVLDQQKLEAGVDEQDCLAGIIGLVSPSGMTRVLEIGPMIVLPAYQGKHIAKHAMGLLLRYVLDRETGHPPGGTPGLGFRRVQWTAHTNNLTSIRCAESMGFEKEALMRWTWVLDETKEGRPLNCEGRGGRMGRDRVLLAVCWDDCERDVRDKVLRILENE